MQQHLLLMLLDAQYCAAYTAQNAEYLLLDAEQYQQHCAEHLLLNAQHSAEHC
jgi:hypothetical protein